MGNAGLMAVLYSARYKSKIYEVTRFGMLNGRVIEDTGLVQSGRACYRCVSSTIMFFK
jgi:hypothetical protein